MIRRGKQQLSSDRLNEGVMPIIAKLMLRKYMLYLQIYTNFPPNKLISIEINILLLNLLSWLALFLILPVSIGC